MIVFWRGGRVICAFVARIKKVTMHHHLTKDEFDALGQISRQEHRKHPSACVARNSKHLSGIKYVEYKKDGYLVLTPKGAEVLFIYRCIEGLRALCADRLASVDHDVLAFLGRKGHVTPCEGTDGFLVTPRGRESLADIDAQEEKAR